jgi:hypothetical protein
VAVAGPDLLFRCDASSRVEVEGALVAEEIDVPCRASMKGLVVAEKQESLGAKVKRPGHGRGAPPFPGCLEAGKERVTAIAFPAEEFSEDEITCMEQFDADL